MHGTSDANTYIVGGRFSRRVAEVIAALTQSPERHTVLGDGALHEGKQEEG
jgi:hypothetical protein